MIKGNIPKPFEIHFYHNGLTGVFDSDGKQIPEYQERHQRAVELLTEDGIDWQTIPRIIGIPRRFNIGDAFHFEDGVWSIIYMYRLKDNPHEWYHCLEETKILHGDVADKFFSLETTPRIVYDVFQNWHDACNYFSGIYMNGNQTTKTTQQLLKLRKV